MGVRNVDVAGVLDELSRGGKPSKGELEAVAHAGASLRADFLDEAFKAINTLTPRTVDFEGFKKCLKSMTDLLMKHGFVSIPEIQLLWIRIEEVER
jgi:hypothetical protein